LGVAVVFPMALARGGWEALGLFALAAASDYLDGPLARRAGGGSTYGTLLDNVADIAFVLVATCAGVARGALAGAVPAAIACAAVAYALASIRRTRSAGEPARAYSVIGHAAGVCNYALVGLLAGNVALPGPAWHTILASGGALVVALNLGAVALRLVPRARASRA
jgi:phosphatidylglycerophosphate synthase